MDFCFFSNRKLSIFTGLSDLIFAGVGCVTITFLRYQSILLPFLAPGCCVLEFFIPFCAWVFWHILFISSRLPSSSELVHISCVSVGCCHFTQDTNGLGFNQQLDLSSRGCTVSTACHSQSSKAAEIETVLLWEVLAPVLEQGEKGFRSKPQEWSARHTVRNTSKLNLCVNVFGFIH